MEQNKNAVSLVDLKCEYAKEPLGIDAESPRLSWKICSDQNNTRQTSYRIIAISNDALLWDSGVVNSAEQCVRYAGKALKSRQRIDWTLTVSLESDEGSHVVSASSFFEMGLLDEADWSAKWIQAEPEHAHDAEALYLHRDFTIAEPVKSARLYQSAHGLYETSLNGKKDSLDVFRPGLMSYYARMPYQTTDVTALVQEGQNSWDVLLGDGWWRGSTGGTLVHNFGKILAYIGQLEITYADGTKEVISSDEQFQWSHGPLLRSDMMFGEVYDARIPQEEGRPAALCHEHTEGSLTAACIVPVREKETFLPKEFYDEAGNRILDFGQNMTGYVKMTLRHTTPGQKVRLIHGEEIKEGVFSIDNCRSKNFPEEPFQEITYICKGAEEEMYKPHFAVFGFQYVKLEGYEEDIREGDFKAIAVYSDMKETGSFTCSNEKINQLMHNILWSQKGNFLEVATDCPTRERNSWTGDAQIYANTAGWLMDVYPFFEKWMIDQKIEQYASGKVGITFPATSSCHDPAEVEEVRKKNPAYAIAGPIGDGNFSEASTGWGDSAVHIPYVMYRRYQDPQILENQYETAKRWVEFERACAKEQNELYLDNPEYHTMTEDGMLEAEYLLDNHFQFGEWNEPIGDGITFEQIFARVKTGDKITATAYLYRSCLELADMAEVLGKDQDAESYRAYASKVKDVYNKYLIKDDGEIQPGHQAPYVRVLALDLVNEEKKQAVIHQLVKEIHASDDHLNTGFLSTAFLLPVLLENGEPELAGKLLETETCPGWLYPVVKGMTTIPESWAAMDTHKDSLNHYSYGAAASFFFEQIAGMTPVKGFRNVCLAPKRVGSLTDVKAVYESPFGTFVSKWEAKENHTAYEFVIPANTTAHIVLENGEEHDVGSGIYHFVI